MHLKRGGTGDGRQVWIRCRGPSGEGPRRDNSHEATAGRL